MSDLFGKKGLLWLKEEPELPEPDGWLLREDVELARSSKEDPRHRGIIKELQKVTKRRLAEDAAARGEFFSVMIRHEVAEMERFPSPKKSLLHGLVPPPTLPRGHPRRSPRRATSG